MEVTYLIANYNYGEWIQDAIDSVLNQTIPCNLCIIDDCSTDDSMDKIDNLFYNNIENFKSHNCRFSLDFPRNILIDKKEKTGPADSRNLGIEHCLDFTDVFAILDADDIVDPYKTEKLLPYFEDESVGVVYADYETLNVDNEFYTNVYKKSFDHFELIKNCIVHSGAFIRKQALLNTKNENGFYDKTMIVAEDWDLWLKLSSKYMIIHHPECLTTVRVSKKNSSHSVNNATWQRCWQKIAEKMQNGYQ